MLRALLAVVVMAELLTAPARAGDYTEAVNKQSKCESAGKVAQSFYGETRDALRSAAAEVDGKVKRKEISEQLGAETKYLFFIGRTAKSSKDAYMQAWAWCMDQK